MDVEAALGNYTIAGGCDVSLSVAEIRQSKGGHHGAKKNEGREGVGIMDVEPFCQAQP